MRPARALLNCANLAAFFLAPDPWAEQERRRGAADEDATLVRYLAYSRMWTATAVAVLAMLALTLLIDVLDSGSRSLPAVLLLLVSFAPASTFWVLLLCGLGRERVRRRFRDGAKLRRMSLAGWAAAGAAAVLLQTLWPL